MKEFVKHPVYGEIVYTEGFWTGKKSLTVNGAAADPVSKNEFLIDGKKAVIKGNYFTGINLCMEDETVLILPKRKWYEIVLVILPILFLLTWGNSAALCAILPVVGGALGGALAGAGAGTSMFLMAKTKSPAVKILTGICVFLGTVLIAFLLAVVLILLFV